MLLTNGELLATSNTTGKAIGVDKDVAFTGSGELDNGTTFTIATATTDAQTDLTSGYIINFDTIIWFVLNG